MDNYSTIYWLTRLDYLQGMFKALAITMGAIIILHYVIKGVPFIENDSWELLKKSWSRATVTFLMVFGILGACFIPNKNEAILILAGGKTLDYVQKDTSLSKIPYQTTTIISQYLEKTLKEMKAEK